VYWGVPVSVPRGLGAHTACVQHRPESSHSGHPDHHIGSVSICICMYVCMYVNTHIHAYVCMYDDAAVYIYVHTYTHTYTQHCCVHCLSYVEEDFLHVHMCAWTYICKHMWANSYFLTLYVCVYVRAHIHAHTFMQCAIFTSYTTT
jgi:hypothetical protein